MEQASDMQQTSEKAAGLSGVAGQLTELAISVKGLVAAITVLGTLAGFYFTGDKASNPSPGQQASIGPALPAATRTEGWAVVGKYLPGKLANPLIKFQLALPRVGETCEALDAFPVYKDHPSDQAGGRILLGDVRKGDMLEVLDIRRGTEKDFPFWVKLRAELHAH